MIRIPLDRWYGGTLEADGRVGRLKESEFNSWHRDSLKRLIGLFVAETVTLVANEAQDYLAERDEGRSGPDWPEPCRVAYVLQGNEVDKFVEQSQWFQNPVLLIFNDKRGHCMVMYSWDMPALDVLSTFRIDLTSLHEMGWKPKRMPRGKLLQTMAGNLERAWLNDMEEL